MNIENILKPGNALKRAFVNLESGMTDVLNEAFMQPSILHSPADERDRVDDTPLAAEKAVDGLPDGEESDAPPPPEETVERITAHTQNRLSAFAAFDKSRSAAHKNLDQIGAALASVICNAQDRMALAGQAGSRRVNVGRTRQNGGDGRVCGCAAKAASQKSQKSAAQTHLAPNRAPAAQRARSDGTSNARRCGKQPLRGE